MQPHLDLACAKLNNTQEELKISQDTTRNLAVKVTELENQLEQFQTTLNTLSPRIKDLEEFPPYLWQVTDFWEKVSRAKNGKEDLVRSEPFYLGLHGYKIRLLMYPNGLREAKNTCISLYVVLMKGQYDPILPWPFSYKVKFTIIDQNPDLKQRQNFTLSFTDPSSETMRRPESEENLGQGFDDFLSHEKLRERSYVVNETLFIKFGASRSGR